MLSFNPDRLQLSVLLDEYLNEVSPMTESQISYNSTYKLVQKYVEGVSFHDVTRAVRYFSPTYMITFENYVGVLKIFFDEQHNYDNKAEQSIKNILINIINENTEVTNDVSKIIDSLKEEFNDKNFGKLPIIKTLNDFIKRPNSDKIQSILHKIVPKNPSQEKIIVPTPNFNQKDFKIHIHLLDLFNIKKCTSFIDIFNQNSSFNQGFISFKIGFAVECQLRNNNKFSKIVFVNPLNNNTNNQPGDEKAKNIYNRDPIYYRIDDTITLEFNLTEIEKSREAKRDIEKKDQDGKPKKEREEAMNDIKSSYEMIMNSPLILKLYTIIIPNTITSSPMKFLYGYIKINLVPILFAHGHEIQLSGNFIPLENQFDKNQISLFYGANGIQVTSKDPVMLSFSLKTDIDPYICYSEPFGKKVTKIDGKDIKELREKTILNSNSRSCQISAIEELNYIHHFLCFYVDANIEFDTDDLFDLLIRDSRKPGPNYSTIVRSPFSLYDNQYSNISPDSQYKDVFRPPMPFKDNPDFYFKCIHDLKNKNEQGLNESTKMSQLERCIILCNALIKSKIPSFVCCGSIDMCDTYCVISLSKEPLTENRVKHIHLIPGHVYPISMLSYSIKVNDNSNRMNSISKLKLNNLFDFNFSSNGQYKDYKSVRAWCLSDILDDANSSSYHITSIFNDTNVWINRQQNTSILRINWNMNDDQLWFPILKVNDNDPIKSYVYSKRKVTFLKSFDKVKYEFYFNYELEQYADQHSIVIDKRIHNLIISNKKEFFSKSPFSDLFPKIEDLLAKLDGYISTESKLLSKVDQILKSSKFYHTLDDSTIRIQDLFSKIESISHLLSTLPVKTIEISENNNKQNNTSLIIMNLTHEIDNFVNRINNFQIKASNRKTVNNKGNLKLTTNDIMIKIRKLTEIFIDLSNKTNYLFKLHDCWPEINSLTDYVDNNLKKHIEEIDSKIDKCFSNIKKFPKEINKLPTEFNDLLLRIKGLSNNIDNLTCTIDNSISEVDFEYKIAKLSMKIQHLEYLVDYLIWQINVSPPKREQLIYILSKLEEKFDSITPRIDDNWLKKDSSQQADISKLEIDNLSFDIIEFLSAFIEESTNTSTSDENPSSISMRPSEINSFRNKIEILASTIDHFSPIIQKLESSIEKKLNELNIENKLIDKGDVFSIELAILSSRIDNLIMIENNEMSPISSAEISIELESTDFISNYMSNNNNNINNYSNTNESDIEIINNKNKSKKDSEKDSEKEESSKVPEKKVINQNQEGKKTIKFYICENVSEDSLDSDTSYSSDSSICDEFEFIDDGSDQKNNEKFYFFRKIEAPYFMMPDELLEYIIENNGLRFMTSFDIIIDFHPLPLNNCKIDIIIAYNAEKLARRSIQKKT